MYFPIFKAVAQTYRLLFSKALMKPVIVAPAATAFAFVGIAEFLLRADGINPVAQEARLYRALLVNVVQLSSSDNFFETMSAALQPELLIWLIELIGGAVLFAGALRFLMRADGAQGGIKFAVGRDEINIAYSWISTILGALATLVTGAALALPVEMILTYFSHSLGVTAIVIFTIITYGFVYRFLIRVSLAAPAAIAEHNLGLSTSFLITEGCVIDLTLFWMYLFVPLAVVQYFAEIAIFGVSPYHSEYLTAVSAKPEMYLILRFVSFLAISAVMVSGSSVAYRILARNRPPNAAGEVGGPI
jgi:hypothetical protein